MTYKEFDAKYNKRHCGKLTHYSIIKETGEVVFQGSVNDADDYWDNNVSCLDAWKQGHEGAIDTGEYVFYTCINEGLYEKYRQKGVIKFD